jgi:hypothetical protein
MIQPDVGLMKGRMKQGMDLHASRGDEISQAWKLACHSTWGRMLAKMINR